MKRQALNKFNAPEVLSVLVKALEAAGLDDTVKELKQKNFFKIVNDAWMRREKTASKTGGAPSTVTFGRNKFPVDRKVWQHVFKQSQKNKKWAENHKYADNPDAWPASSMSIEMLKDRLTKSVQEQAEYSYAYFYHRSHMLGQAWGGNIAIDPAAQRDWEKITGKPIPPEDMFGGKKRSSAQVVQRFAEKTPIKLAARVAQRWEATR